MVTLNFACTIPCPNSYESFKNIARRMFRLFCEMLQLIASFTFLTHTDRSGMTDHVNNSTIADCSNLLYLECNAG